MAGYCDQCEKHCPLDALGCGRGRRMYGQPAEEIHGEGRFSGHEPGGAQRGRYGRRGGHESRGEYDFHEGRGFCEEREFHGPHGGHGRHGRDGHGPEERGHRGPKGRGPSQQELQQRLEEGDLSELMHISGHMLRSPKAGAARGQGRVMAILAERGGISQRELQEMLHIQPGSASEIIGKLEAKGLLSRARGEDRRGNMLTITESGRSFAENLNTAEDIFSVLDQNEKEQLKELLKKLLTDWIRRFG